MAWCVGSVFPTPDLLTTPAFGSPLLDALDPPQHLFDTGCTFCHETFPEAEPHDQVDAFLENNIDTFFPKDLLCEHLQEDAASNLESSQIHFKVGNRLEGIENREGALQLFFPVGENIDRVGSCLISFDLESSRKICNDDSDMLYSSSLSIRQPILQIAANKIESSWDSKLACVPLAVRTPYQVHWLMSHFQDNDISLVLGGVENFDCSTSHVVWNPHISGETAVILRNGDVSIFDFASSKSNVTPLRFRIQDYRSMEGFNCSYSRLANKRKRKKFRDLKFEASMDNLWSFEYAWHPRNLLVAGGEQIDLIDLRQKPGSKQFQCSLANAPSCSQSFSNCNGMHKMEHFTALARGIQDDVFQFVAASTYHLMLYDIRRPKTPLLQWEHRMQLEPPRLLHMFNFSDACSKSWKQYDKHLAGGRGILACGFKSGEMLAFSYGPQPQPYPQKAERNVGDLGVAEKLFSWDFPVKLTTSKVQCDKNLEHAFEAHGNIWQTLLPRDCEAVRLVGLIGPSTYSESSTFKLVQLTGSGSILSQSLHVMEEQGLSTGERSLLSSNKSPFARRSPGRPRTKTKHYRMEYMPAFFAFMQEKSGFPELTPKAYLTADVHTASTPSSIEVTHNETKTKLHGPFKEYVMPGPILEESDNNKLQGGEMSSKGDESTGDFFRELCSGSSPVNLSFKDTGATLQSEELGVLTGLRNLLQQWQQSFQPYVAHCNLDTKKVGTSL